LSDFEDGNSFQLEQQQVPNSNLSFGAGASSTNNPFQNFSFGNNSNKPPQTPGSSTTQHHNNHNNSNNLQLLQASSGQYQMMSNNRYNSSVTTAPNVGQGASSTTTATTTSPPVPSSVSPQVLKALLMRRRSSDQTDSLAQSQTSKHATSSTGNSTPFSQGGKSQSNNNITMNANNNNNSVRRDSSQGPATIFGQSTNTRRNSNNPGTNKQDPLIHFEDVGEGAGGGAGGTGGGTGTNSGQNRHLLMSPQLGDRVKNMMNSSSSVSGGMPLPPGVFKKLPGGWIADASIAPLVNSLSNEDVLSFSTSNNPFFLSNNSFGAVAATSFGLSLRNNMNNNNSTSPGIQGGNQSTATQPGNQSTTATNHFSSDINNNNNNGSPSPALEPSEQYIPIMTLGKGSFSKVYLVKDKNTGNTFVNKIMRWDNGPKDKPGDAKNRHRLAKRDVELCANCAHPNIVQYVDSFETENATHVILEHIEGGDLAKELDRRRQMGRLLRVEVALRFWIQVALALDYMHVHKMLHRDVKPANIMICRATEGFVKLADFGFAARSFQENGEQFGSPFWASPEMFFPVNHTNKCDVWSAGVLLYELLSLRLPFPQNNTQAHAATKESCTYEALPSHVPDEVKQAVRQMLQYEPDDRPSLRHLLANNPILRSALVDLLEAVRISPNMSETMKEVSVAHISEILGIPKPILPHQQMQQLQLQQQQQRQLANNNQQQQSPQNQQQAGTINNNNNNTNPPQQYQSTLAPSSGSQQQTQNQQSNSTSTHPTHASTLVPPAAVARTNPQQ